MAQIVTGQETVKFGKLFQNQFAMFTAASQYLLINPAFGGWRLRQMLCQRGGHRPGIQNIPAEQHGPQAQNMVRGFAVDQRTLPGCIGVNHPAERRSVTGR